MERCVADHGTSLGDARQSAEGGIDHGQHILGGLRKTGVRKHGNPVCDFNHSSKDQCDDTGNGKLLQERGDHGKQHNIPTKSGQCFKTIHDAGIYDFKIHLRSRCRLFLRVERGAVFCAACVCREQDTAQQKRRKIQDQQGNCRQMGQPKLGVEDEACDKDRTDVVGNDK